MQIAVSNGSRDLILSNRVRRQRSIFFLYSLVAFFALIVGGAIIKWEVGAPLGASSTVSLVFINIFLAIIVVLLSVSYTYWLRVVTHYFYGEMLLSERNRFALVYGVIAVLVLA